MSAGVLTATQLNSNGYVDIQFNDLNGVGLSTETITDADPEFTLLVGGVAPDVVFEGAGVPVPGEANTYRYSFEGTIPEGVITVETVQGSFSDNGGIGNFSEMEIFTAVGVDGDGNMESPGPIAELASPGNGGAVDVLSLNGRRYIDVTFVSQDGTPINQNTINGDEFNLSGPGVDQLVRGADGLPEVTIIQIAGFGMMPRT